MILQFKILCNNCFTCLILWVANYYKSNKSGLAEQSILMYYCYATKGTTKLQNLKTLFSFLDLQVNIMLFWNTLSFMADWIHILFRIIFRITNKQKMQSDIIFFITYSDNEHRSIEDKTKSIDRILMMVS